MQPYMNELYKTMLLLLLLLAALFKVVRLITWLKNAKGLIVLQYMGCDACFI